MSGTLFLVPNTLDFGVVGSDPPPLSDDLPLGVVRTAARLAHWVAENAKTTRAFLKRVDAVVPLAQALQAVEIVELPRPPKGSKAPASGASLDALLAPALAGHDMGLISEAGLPAVADPGALLVDAAHRLSIKVVPLAGASSLMLALAASGLNGQSFAFVGYLPVEAAERAARIRELEALSRKAGQTQMLIETPYRNEAMLDALLASLAPTTRLSVSCGLTLACGWTRTDTVARWKAGKSAIPKDIPAVFSLLV
ncbi:SAM-dependent methyltransferase [Piscinibacter terrae]|uniref:Ribosomal RNA small subunit methyltransferase I n=1 Tax=Piscinibacter terrae TaxID=2496871 RepID=A0A3N7HHV3_9BURK|nr:SAM-dependent methyltransferase [Albitalea terrae]RQP21634.1 ribosomal RNA small subunit methyltransferase I [Albitalea terrae]